MITLTPLRAFDVPIQAPCITPENFAGKTVAEIAKMPVTEGVRNLTLADLFKIEQSPAETPSITINGECSKVKRVGQGMKTGEIVVNGNIGMHTGERMNGGKIIVNGNSWRLDRQRNEKRHHRNPRRRRRLHGFTIQRKRLGHERRLNHR